MRVKLAIIFPFIICLVANVSSEDETGKRPKILYPCKGTNFIQYKIPEEQPEHDGEKNFLLVVNKKMSARSTISLTLILPSENNLEKPSSQYTFISEEKIEGTIYKDKNSFKRWLRTVNGRTPFISSLIINDEELCVNPSYNIRENEATPQGTGLHLPPNKVVDTNCGRRKLSGAGLIVNGFETKPGDWPWHAALSLLDQSVSRYICGGTLISKSMVLTAAHCVTVRGVPVVTSALSVSLGKFNLFSGNTGEQEKEVLKIIVHKKFNPTLFFNDISLLQLQSEAVFSNYVQPACLWRNEDINKVPNLQQLFGTVVGWGINQLNQVALTLRQVRLPRIPDVECIKTKPEFFAAALDGGNFCAGYKNGTSVCNGDSGGGFMVFIPDNIGDRSDNPPGSWHIRGITSNGVVKENVVCDPYEYSIFTDVSKYLGWIQDNMDN